MRADNPPGALEIAIEGIGLYGPGLPNWSAACASLSGATTLAPDASARPSPTLLSPNERRRAPESVLLALSVAEQACAMAGRVPRDLPNIFASSFGDLPINDYLCGELARDPLQLSPTKFHNSVHNAPAGYWTIATGCMATSTALSAGDATFAAGLLEAALLAKIEDRPVLFAAFDVGATGPLVDVTPSRTPFGVAFVLGASAASPGPSLRLRPGDAAAPELASLPPSLHALHAGNPIAEQCLPLLIALATRTTTRFELMLAAQATLHLEISF